MALPASLIISLTAAAGLYYTTETDTTFILFSGISLLVFSFLTVYAISAKLHRSRLEKLNHILEHFLDEKIKTPYKSHLDNRDELDLLIKEAIEANHTIHKELNRLNRMENYRKEFIGDISHELKTPIFAIQGFVETLINGAIHDSEVNELFLEKTMRNVNRLIFLTNDLMEISKLETGELKSSISDVYLRDIILDVVESLQYKAQKEEIELRLKDFSKNLQVKADRNQIKQVLINLIENGMKYNRPGGYVEIGIDLLAEKRDKVVVFVKDDGLGIAPDDLHRVTERFYRVDKSRSRDKGGTGLGLAIVKHIIEAHGERLMIESKPELGSTFSFTLTIAGFISV